MSYSFGVKASMGEDVGVAIDKAYEDSIAGYSDAAAAKAIFDEVTPGWSDCFMTVSVSQQIPKPEAS